MAKPKKGEEFSPAPQFRTLYYIYMAPFLVIVLLLWQIPFLLGLNTAAGFLITMFIAVPTLLIFLFAALWVALYYRTIKYSLSGDEMTWRRGVWFRNTGIVPYNRITNVDISQGPVSRMLGIASLKIQTAGYSGQNMRSSEIKIEGMENFEELRERIMEYVRGRKPVAVETYEKGKGDPVLNELVKIRKLLEKRK